MWESFIFDHLAEWHFLAYVLIFIGMVIEGETVLLAAIFFALTGHLNLWLVLSTSFAGMVVGDSLWYWFGAYINRFLYTQKFVRTILPVIDSRIKKRPMMSIFIAKFVYFLHRIVLIRIRPSGISFKRFLKADIPAIFAWIILSTGLGIAFTASFSLLGTTIKYVEIGMLLAVVILIAGEHGISKLYRKKLLREANAFTELK